ncbi:unnamed protein product [Closterium sp. Naga37s-1]|nr:unnamed protein product [Closterium sp. Naga37s-1]
MHIPSEWVNTLPFTSPILPPFTILIKGTKRETAGKFMAKPVTLFAYPSNLPQSLGCGVELAFTVNFTFSLVPQSGAAGSNGFAFVIAAKAKVGRGDGVGYGGVGARSLAVEFDTFQNGNHSDASRQHVGLNINGLDRSLVSEVSPYTLTDGNAYTAWVDYEPGEPGDPGTMRVFLAGSMTKPEEPLLQEELSLCAVLQGGVRQGAFYFGFVASTTVKPFQLHGIVRSAVQTGVIPLKSVRIKQQARGLALSLATYAAPRASPFLRYVSTDYELASNNQDSWRIRDFHTWDSVDFLGWSVKDQANCNACWAYAVVASIEAAYGIARHQSAPQLSMEPLFAAMGLAGFERTSFKGYVGLMLAVRRQPVVVHIEASAATFVAYDGTFKYQDPECYTGNLNHVVLVVGYFINRNDGSQSRIAPPFWIIRNSWGEEWGVRGHMRMDIQGGDGVCGINVLPGIYPVVKIPGDPCGNSSYKGDQDLSGMNPCGRFRCNAVDDSSYTCSCTIEGAARQPFVEADNGDGSSTCAYVDVCGSYFKNPCYVGTCINDGRGSYSCICPLNYVESTTVYDTPTCDPVNTTASSMAVSGDNWLCSDVYPLVGISLADFTLQNEAVDCSGPLPRGTVLQLSGTPATPCTTFFYSLHGDLCSTIADQASLDELSLPALNPGLDCSEPIKAGSSVCIERNPAFAFTVPECVKHGMLTPQDTCERLLQRTVNEPNLSADHWAELYRNNPGLTCSDSIPASASVVGSKIGVQVRSSAEKASKGETAVSVPESVYLLRPKVSDWDAKRAAHIAANPGCNRTSKGKPRVMMVTGSNNKPCGEHGESDFLLLKFLKNKQDYARIHDLQIFYGMGPMNKNFPAFWVKIPLLRMLMLKYPEVEWFFWIDSDAMITDMAFEYPIEEHSSATVVLSGFPDSLFKKKDWVAINTGAFFIRNSQDGLDFLDDWSTFGSSEAVRSQWGTVASKTLHGRADWPVDDQTALVLLLLGEGETPENKKKGVTLRKDKWLPRIEIDWRTTLHGYWVSFVDK